MVSSDFRKEARKKLTGKWGTAACIFLAFILLSCALNYVKNMLSDNMQSLVSIAISFIEIPLLFGFTASFVNLFNGESVNPIDFISLGFKNFGKSWGVTLQIIFKLIVPYILIIISYTIIALGSIASATYLLAGYSTSTPFIFTLVGVALFMTSLIWYVTKSYYYKLAYIIAIEKPELSSKEVVQESQRLMTEKRGKLFCLQLSFIGWALLTVLTLGIGLLWLIPYMKSATIAFYKFADDDIDNNSTEE